MYFSETSVDMQEISSKVNPLTFVFSASSALFAMIFLGLFNNERRIESISALNGDWFIVNRGLFYSWNGVALESSNLALPLVRLPFLFLDDGRGSSLVKILDLSVFLPLYCILFVFSFFVIHYVLRVEGLSPTQEKRNFVTGIFVTLIGSLLLYFMAFARI